MVRGAPFPMVRFAVTLYGPVLGVQTTFPLIAPAEVAVPVSYQTVNVVLAISMLFVPNACTSTLLMPGCNATALLVQRPSQADQKAGWPFTSTFRVSMTLASPYR